MIEFSKICVERTGGETEYVSLVSADAGQAALRGRGEPREAEAASPLELSAVPAPLSEPSRSGLWSVVPDPAPGTGEVAQALPAAPAAAGTPVSARGSAAGRDRVYLVLGSFTHRAAARAFARAQDRRAVAVVPAKVKGRTVYRVVVGPLTAGGAASIRRELAVGGLKDSWTSTRL
ncbi:MAG: SPOR domain-containing protein [Alphaproteobacteria bacterium]